MQSPRSAQYFHPARTPKHYLDDKSIQHIFCNDIYPMILSPNLPDCHSPGAGERYSAEEAKDQCKHYRKDDRRHNREVDADISVRTLILDISWQKRKSRRDVGPPCGRAFVRKPTNNGKCQYRDNEDL